MLKRAMVLVLLGCVGLTAGLAFGTLISSNEFRLTFAVPAHTVPAADLVSIERGHHPGVHLTARGPRVIELWTTHHPIDVYEEWSTHAAQLAPHRVRQ